MSESWKENKAITGLLLLVALTVWIAVGYRVVGGLSEGEEVATTPAEVQPTSGGYDAPRSEFVYEASYRDPFAPQLWEPREPTSDDEFDAVAGISEEQEYIPEPPRLRLVAVVGETAVIETETGATQVVRAGTYLGDVRILAITPSRVMFDYFGYDYHLNID